MSMRKRCKQSSAAPDRPMCQRSICRTLTAGERRQLAAASLTLALPPIYNINLQAALNAESKPFRNRHAGTSPFKLLQTSSQLVATSAPEGLLARSTSESMVNDGNRHSAADTQQEHQILNLPDEVAALVKQHHLKLQLVCMVHQVPPAAPLPPPLLL